MSSLSNSLVHFYDVPWTLYRCPGSPPPIQRETVIRSIRTTLLKQSVDDDFDTQWPHIELSQCIVDPISIRSEPKTFSGVAVFAEFTMGPPFRFLHYNDQAKKVSLLLVRGSVGSQRLNDSFFDLLEISGYQMLNLPGSFLSLQLESYVEALAEHRPMEREQLNSFISHVIGKLDITVATMGPVAPNLKSLQISVPAGNVWTWLSTLTGPKMLMRRLTDHLESMTGMKLDMASKQGPEKTSSHTATFIPKGTANARLGETESATVGQTVLDQTLHTEPEDPDFGAADMREGPDAFDNKKILMTISEVSCAGFKLTRAGRFTLKKDPVNWAEHARARDGIEHINAILLGAILHSINDRDGG